MRRTFSVVTLTSLTTGLLLGGVALAPAGQATTTCAGFLQDSLPNGYSLAVGDSVTVTVSCIVNSNVDTAFVGSIAASVTSGIAVTPQNVTAAAGVAMFTVLAGSVGTPTVSFSGGGQQTASILFVTGGGSGSGTSTATVDNRPVQASLSLDLAASGASCTGGSAISGVEGDWMTLPAADACTSTTRPGAKLLGWSTSASFPVALAQSQVNKGWGAIDETINGVRMIFIPAGQATFVSGSNSLHPIWAN